MTPIETGLMGLAFSIARKIADVAISKLTKRPNDQQSSIQLARRVSELESLLTSKIINQFTVLDERFMELIRTRNKIDPIIQISLSLDNNQNAITVNDFVIRNSNDDSGWQVSIPFNFELNPDSLQRSRSITASISQSMPATDPVSSGTHLILTDAVQLSKNVPYLLQDRHWLLIVPDADASMDIDLEKIASDDGGRHLIIQFCNGWPAALELSWQSSAEASIVRGREHSLNVGPDTQNFALLAGNSLWSFSAVAIGTPIASPLDPSLIFTIQKKFAQHACLLERIHSPQDGRKSSRPRQLFLIVTPH